MRSRGGIMLHVYRSIPVACYCNTCSPGSIAIAAIEILQYYPSRYPGIKRVANLCKIANLTCVCFTNWCRRAPSRVQMCKSMEMRYPWITGILLLSSPIKLIRLVCMYIMP